MPVEKENAFSHPLSVRFLFGLLIGWSLFLASGSVLFADSLDWRKPMVVLATMGVFLGTWWIALKSSGR